MAGFVFRHFMDGVMDGVVAKFFRAFGEFELASAGAVFGIATELEVLLRTGGEDFAEQFGKFGGVFGLFESVTLVGVSDFRIAFALGLTAHGEVHADFRAFAGEVGLEAFDDLRIRVGGNTDGVLASPLQFFGFFNFEFRAGAFALGAERGGLVTFVDITADGANKTFHGLLPFWFWVVRWDWICFRFVMKTNLT